MDQTVIFDLDGTLADTRKVSGPALKRIAQASGLAEPTDTVIAAAIGVSGDDFYRLVYPDAAPEALSELADRVFAQEKLIAVALGKDLLFDGAEALLDALSNAGCRLAIASTGEEAHVESVLRVTGLTGRFETIVCGHNDKTAMLADILKRHGIAPASAVMVGDKPKDSGAASDNGLPSVGAGWGFSTADELTGFTLTAQTPTDAIAAITLLQTVSACIESPRNRIPKDAALLPELAGQRIYEFPLFGVADSRDDAFAVLKQPGVIGPHVLSPLEWQPDAASVISMFFPFTEAVRKSNRRPQLPSEAWLHGRYEGQETLNAILRDAAGALEAVGFSALVPSSDARYAAPGVPPFSSRWSERHVAYACGLGTFGLSHGLITKRGMAGRFGSLLTTAALRPVARTYTDITEWCTRCGACIARCPVQAITPAGKQHPPCSDFLDDTRARHAPRYGCGKCQTAVPCESGRPLRGAPATS